MPYVIIDSQVGKLTIREENGVITHVLFGEVVFDDKYEETTIITKAVTQLNEYFAKTRVEFQLPLSPVGTAFREKVWAELYKIPYGTTISYGQLAKNVGNPKASRAVGGANHHNPISIIIPCHRVIGADGDLTGYGGGMETKRFLLTLEGVLK